MTPVHYRGKVWCVRVPSGAFVARRNGHVFITGNSGFPKGGDVGKRIDEMLGAEREVVGSYAVTREFKGRDYVGDSSHATRVDITAPATDEAARWHDCSTTLKPAWEPILLAQKPHEGSAARNCVEHGAGALRVGACRIATAESTRRENKADLQWEGGPGKGESGYTTGSDGGRWPANLALDEEAAAALDEQSGDLKSGGGDKRNKSAPKGWSGNWTDSASKRDWTVSSGGASRFFYCAKANKGDRDEGLDHLPEVEDETHDLGAKLERWPDGSLRPRVTPPAKRRNAHPTVKPEALMRWLSRLVCPPWGELLDPFAGSGSTGKAAALEGLRATCVEREPDFAEVARARVEAALRRAKIDS